VIAVAHRARDLVTGMHWNPNWVRAEDDPASPCPVSARLFAIIGSYNDEDIIEATVANAFTQGVERVFVVDNASTDDTVARAEQAGAHVAEVFQTTCFEESLRILLMNSVVWRVSSAEASEHIWWLWLDDDEFPQGPEDQSIKQYLDGLDRRFRVVGSQYYQHYPHRKPEYLRGFHPLEFQPLCEPFSQPQIPRCSSRHYKHPLQRFDRGGPFIAARRGFHTCDVNDRVQLVEPTSGIVTHHFQFRDEEATRDRLKNLYGARNGRDAQLLRTGTTDGGRRLRSVDAVYARRWRDVDNLRHLKGDVGIDPRPWSEFTTQPEPRRWYDTKSLADALAAWNR
jgi:glycosyltransferase involved in cell wall biosynthesis